MEKLYNEKFVNCINFNEFIKELNEGTLELDKSDVRKYVAYQHALLKYVEDKPLNTKVLLCFSKFYDDFKKYPYLFSMSPLLDNRVIDKYADQREKNTIKEIRNDYYNKTATEELYNEALKRELTDKEKNRLYSNLIRPANLLNNDIDEKELVKNILSKNSTISKMNILELQFLANYFTKYTSKNAEVYITDEHPIIRCKESNGLITINKGSYKNTNIEEFIHIACYASRLLKNQESNANNKLLSFDIALDQLFVKYLDEADYAVFSKKYKYSIIDYQSVDKGYYDAEVQLAILKRPDLADLLLASKMKDETGKNQSMYYKDHGYKPLMLSSEEEMTCQDFPADSFIIKRLDEIIKNHPDELDNYPILTKFYNKDGSRKSFNKLINLRINEDNNSARIFDNFINYGINEGSLSRLPLPKNDNEIYKLFDLLSEISENKSVNLRELLNKKDECNSEELGYTILYQINQLSSILEYVLNNSNTLVNLLKNKGNINQKSILYSFVKDIRSINISNITNPIILNNDYVMYGLVQLVVLNNELIGVFNRAFVDQNMENISDEDRLKEIVTPSGETKCFEDFIYQDVLPNINANLQYECGDYKQHVKSIIDSYNSNPNNRRKH